MLLGRSVIGAHAPNLTERDEAAPDFSAIHQRPVIGDFDVCQPDPLFGDRMLADVRKRKIGPDRNAERKSCDGGNKDASAFHNTLI